MRRRHLAVFAAVLITLSLAAWVPGTQSQDVTRTELLRAEDARGDGPRGLQPLIDGLRVPALRQLASRGLGRQERPELTSHLFPWLSDETLTATVAEALAQSLANLPPDSLRSVEQREWLNAVYRQLAERARVEANPANRAALARSIGRLPYGDSRQARMADSVLLELAVTPGGIKVELPALAGVVQGLYSLARARRVLGSLSRPAVDYLQQVASAAGVVDSAYVAAQRVAWLALAANGTVEPRYIDTALQSSPDAQLRRLVVAALPNVNDSTFQRAQLARVAGDRSFMVRLEWVRVYRQIFGARDCQPLLSALNDTVHHVRLAAIDALVGTCPQRDAALAALREIIERGPSDVSRRSANDVSWHARAHALVALARMDSGAAGPLLARDSRHPVWQVRMYAARAATVARDTVVLSRLAFDSVGNVREAAVAGLSNAVGHVADLVYARALQSRDYHVVLAAARALEGAPAVDSIRPAVVQALLRITREQRQTSRDPRMALLARLREFGRREDASSLTRLLNDVDPLVAQEAGEVFTHLTGNPAPRVAARSSTRLVTPPASIIHVRVTMSAETGGGVFELEIDGNETPMTAARMIDLIRRRYYDGLTFHRVVPNFVLQGGSPGMNEYVGDGPFMRDELGLRSHLRGTLGVSTRGRDTGDAQWFINLVDNYRLDHEYTVFGTITRGMDVVDRILEGDIIESVRVVP